MIKHVNMSNLQEKTNKEYPLYDIQNSISKTDEYNGNEIQFIKRSAFQNGYEQCQKYYEEKLRWIPISEKTPSETVKLEVKTVEGHIHLATYISEIGKFYSDFINSPYQIVEWRSFL